MSIAFTDAALFEHCTVIFKHSYIMKPGLLSTGMEEKAQKLASAVCGMRGTEGHEDKPGSAAAAPKKEHRLERERDYLKQHGIFLSLEKTVHTTARATRLSLKKREQRTLPQLARKKALQSFAKCVTECVLMKGRPVLDAVSDLTFVKLELPKRTLSDIE